MSDEPTREVNFCEMCMGLGTINHLVASNFVEECPKCHPHVLEDLLRLEPEEKE